MLAHLFNLIWTSAPNNLALSYDDSANLCHLGLELRVNAIGVGKLYLSAKVRGAKSTAYFWLKFFLRASFKISFLKRTNLSKKKTATFVWSANIEKLSVSSHDRINFNSKLKSTQVVFTTCL
jgi:deoxyinosine 3'endonuclease (endonuclease V)